MHSVLACGEVDVSGVSGNDPLIHHQLLSRRAVGRRSCSTWSLVSLVFVSRMEAMLSRSAGVQVVRPRIRSPKVTGFSCSGSQAS